jgi:hypothetical protein
MSTKSGGGAGTLTAGAGARKVLTLLVGRCLLVPIVPKKEEPLSTQHIKIGFSKHMTNKLKEPKLEKQA